MNKKLVMKKHIIKNLGEADISGGTLKPFKKSLRTFTSRRKPTTKPSIKVSVLGPNTVITVPHRPTLHGTGHILSTAGSLGQK